MIPYWYIPYFHIGPVPINIWGFFVSLGFAVGIWVAYKQALKWKINAGVIVDMAFWMIVSSIVVARIAYVVLYNFGYYVDHLWEIIRVDQGGLSSYGGFIGALIVFFVYTRKIEKIKYADAIMFALPLGWFIGRIGCFLIHDHPGVLTNFFGGVKYLGGARHDLGLYESLNGLILFVLFVVFKKFFEKRAGMFVVFGSVWYGLTRFLLDFLRVSDAMYFGLTPAQYASLLLLAFGIYWCFKNKYYLYDGKSN